jgi:endo-1,3(4)-beta-glucanase
MPDDSQQAIFDRFSGCIVQGGNVEALDESTYMFQWKTSGDCSNGLLHFAQQHHIDSFDTSTAAELPGIYSYSATRGLMRGVVTKSTLPVWKLVEKQDIPVDYYPANKPPSGLVQQYQILENLRNDIAANWDMPLWGSYYFNGKLAQKYAGLCLMANDPNVVGSNTSLLQSCLTKLRTVMTPMAQNSWTYPLVYDEIYRGIVSSQGFKVKDYWVDFGNTVYNDHHYHYGYWLVAAAIVNYLDPSWSELPRLNIVMGYLYRDVANPLEEGDTSFPKFRNFDWFRGHSYSHGVTPFADGKDEESTSEDINFHYGLYLYGLSIGNKRLHTIGKLMMKLNAHSIRTYVLLTKDNRIHPSNFVPNHVTGIYFDNKVDYATWFGAEKYKIHGIQMIPVTPVTEFVRTYDFVIQEWTDILSNLPLDNTNPWMSLLYVNYATINKQNALSVLQVVALDEGLSRSWALYMAASRPDRNSSS